MLDPDVVLVDGIDLSGDPMLEGLQVANLDQLLTASHSHHARHQQHSAHFLVWKDKNEMITKRGGGRYYIIRGGGGWVHV